MSLLREIAEPLLCLGLGVAFADPWREIVHQIRFRIRDRRDVDGWRCRRCGRSEWRATPHPTRYATGAAGGVRAILALCESCFGELATPEARYPYYSEMLVELRERLAADGDDERLSRLDGELPAIVAAVRVGA